MIDIREATKIFSEGLADEQKALNNISVNIRKGEYVVLLGSNGSGKSTLLNSIAGNVFLSSGKVFINGEDVTNIPEHKRSRWISRIFQNPLSGTASELSVIDNFRLASLRTKSKTLKLGINSAFRKNVSDKIASLNLGIEKKLDQPVGMLSGGQRQALTLLMAVMDDSEILLMDEPASALDPRTAELIMKLADKIIKEYKLTSILVTHNLKDALSYGDRIILLREGKIEKDILRNNTQVSISDLYEWF